MSHELDDPVLDQAAAWCLRLSEGGLGPDEQGAFEAWLGADPAHRAAFDDTARTWRAMETASLEPELIGLRRSALDNFRRAQRARWRGGRGRARALGALAASLLIAMVAGGLWWRSQPQDYTTGVGERRVVALADGSMVSLDASTEVDVRYRRDRRELWLVRGRAKFAVAKDPTRPFTVAAADKVVVATGTEFSVERLGDRVHVILYEGHVAVLAKAPHGARGAPVRLKAGAGPADVLLTPGRELVVPVAAEVAEVAPTDLSRASAWEAGQVVFDDEPLASAVERINRYAAEPLAVGDAAAGRMRVNGVYTAGDTRAFVEGATGILPLWARVVDGRTVLVSAP